MNKMKRNGKSRVFVLDSEEDEISSSGNEADTDTENDENYEIGQSDESISSVDSVSKPSTSKRKIDKSKTKGKLVQKKTNNIRTNKQKRSRPIQKDLEDVLNARKRKKANDETDHQTNRMSEREHTKTNRYGTRESAVNFDDFFTNLAMQQKQNTQNQSISIEPSIVRSDESISTSSLPNDQLNESLSMVRDTLKMMDAKIDAQFAVMAKNCARIEALLKCHKKPIDGSQSKSNEQNELFEVGDQYEIQLKEMGLPATEVNQLKRIEEHLNNMDYENQMVIVFPLFIRFVYIL